MDKHTQESRILAALNRGNTLTALDAVFQFGTTRLGARIYDLRRKGYKIATHIMGKGSKHWAVYWMRPKDRRKDKS
jgi:hypothetical protein